MKNFLHGEPWKPILLNTNALAQLLCPLCHLETTLSMHRIHIDIFVQPRHHKVMELRGEPGGHPEDSERAPSSKWIRLFLDIQSLSIYIAGLDGLCNS